MPRIVAASLLLGLVIGSVTPAMAGDAEHAFIQAASIGGQFEISSSRLALQNSQNADIRNFAQAMVDDHTQIGNQLKTVLSSSPLDTQQPTPVLDHDHQKMLDRLNTAKGDAFDKLYVRDQVAAHKEAVKVFRDYAEEGHDEALKSFATEMLPTLQQHQQHVLELRKSM